MNPWRQKQNEEKKLLPTHAKQAHKYALSHLLTHALRHTCIYYTYQRTCIQVKVITVESTAALANATTKQPKSKARCAAIFCQSVRIKRGQR